MKLISILALALGASLAQAQTINAVYFAQTHVQKATDSTFGLVGDRDAWIKVHVTAPGAPASPSVTATLSLNSQTLVLPLTGPATLPASIADGLGVVQHTNSNTFTGTIPAAWVKKGLQVTVNAGTATTTITDMKVSAPTKVIMTMTDVHYFAKTTGDYVSGTFAEVEAKWPVTDLEVRRLNNVVFRELVIPPRSDVSAQAARVRSKAEYYAQTGLSFDGEQAAALEWNGALKRAAGTSGRWSLYYLNVYNAVAGGQAGGFAGVGNGTSEGILHHELGHALSLPHWGDNAAYPYKGDMYGIQAPNNYNGTHAGPVWAFDLRTKAYIPPTVQSNNVGGKPVGTYKVDPMQGGGEGWQEPAYILNHFSDYSVNQMRSYLNSHVVVWNASLNSWAQWNQTAGAYTTTVSNNGVQFPTTRDTQVISILASMSGGKPAVNMVYPPIGPYTAGLIRLFDPTVAADRTAANSIFSPGSGSDYCVRVVQGGVTKTYMLAASSLTSPALTDGSSLETEAINLPAADGAVTRIELLSTPNVEDVGLPANPTVFYTWAPLMPATGTFDQPPTAKGPTAVTMTAVPGEVEDGYTGGTVEYLFTETTGNPGATSSGWQTSRSYTDTGLQPNTTYSYTVSMRAGTLSSPASAASSATTTASSNAGTITVASSEPFTVTSGSGYKAVTNLGTFNSSGADKLVVAIALENANNDHAVIAGVRYNGIQMIEAVQQTGGTKTGALAIYYLDNPGPVGTGITVSGYNPNGGLGTAYALNGTKPGYGAFNSRTGTNTNSVPLTTSASNSLVIAALLNSGNPNSAGTPTATSPLTQSHSAGWGSQWGSLATGHQQVANPGNITPTFSTATGGSYSISIAAVEFIADALPAALWTQTAGGAQNWTTAANWNGSTVPSPVAGDTADFSTVNIVANTTLNLGANRTAQNWKFGDTSGSQSWIVSSGFTLTLAGTTPGFEITNGTTRIESIVDGTAGLAKTGAGTLTLTAANTYTGATTISAGTLQIGNGGTTGSLAPSSSISNNATLVFNRSDTLTQGTDFSSVISGTGSLAMNGSGTLILSGSNTYTGATTISAGTLQIGTGGGTGTLSISSAITNNASLVFNRSNNVIQGSGFADAISGTGSITNIGAGSLTLNSANTYSGLTTASSGSIKVLDANALGTTAAGTVVNGTGTGAASNARLELEGGITVTGEALTLNGVGNFYGALSSTSGSNTWAGNVTIGSAGTRLGSTTGNTLTVSGIIDSGTVETGLVIRTQDLTSIVVLSGANTYLGDTNLLIGELQLAGGNNRLPVASRLTMGNAANLAEFDLNGRSQEVAGIAINSGATAANNSINNSSATAATLTVNPVGTSAFAGILKGNLALTKSGTGTQTLSGANTYSGATRIDNGVLQSGLNDTLPTTTALSLGSGATVGSLNLATFNQTIASLAVNSDGTDSNGITIGSGRTLTVTGNVTVGFNSSPAADTTTRLSLTGLGTLSVAGTTFQVGGSINSGFGNAATLDMSGLSNFIYNNSAGTFRVGDATNSSSAGTGSSTVILADNSTITAQTFTMNSPAAAAQLVRLGSGPNIINADTIQIGAVGNRSPGTLNFNEATGTLTVRAKDGLAAANMTVGYSSGTTAVHNISTVDLTGHSADLLLGTLQIGGRTGSGGAASTGSFSFDAGNLAATGITVGLRAAGTATGNVVGTLNLAGGNVTIGTAGLSVGRSTSPTTGFSTTGTVNISGGTVTIGQTSGTSITLGSSTIASVPAAAALNLTGGSVTLAGDLIRGTAVGSVTSTLLLNGPAAVLDMGGHDITGLTGVTFTNGSLKNLGILNTGLTLAGTGSRVIEQGTGVSGQIQGAITGPGVGLSKQGGGTLTLGGLNTYSGDTTVGAGTLVLADNARLSFIIGATPGTNNRIAGTGTVTILGDFTIDTTLTDASALTSGTWTLVEAATLNESFGSTFTLIGTGWSETANVWTRTAGTKKYTFSEATGILTLSPAASFSSWIDGFFPGETNASIIGATADPDLDGIPNGVEMVIGGNPKLGMDTALLPTLQLVTNPVAAPAIPPGSYLLFTYRRSDLSMAAGLTASCETNSDLSGTWTSATGAPGVVIQVDDNFAFTPAAPNTDRVRVYVPRGSNTKGFVRLKVAVP